MKFSDPIHYSKFSDIINHGTSLEYDNAHLLSMSEEKLEEFLKTGKDWAKVKTSVPGVFVLKMPGSKNREPSLSVEVNPVDASGSPTKRRGLIIRSVDELLEFKDILGNEKVETLLEMLEDVNPDTPESKQSKEVIEI
jgi:hypothetical protein